MNKRPSSAAAAVMTRKQRRLARETGAVQKPETGVLAAQNTGENNGITEIPVQEIERRAAVAATQQRASRPNPNGSRSRDYSPAASHGNPSLRISSRVAVVSALGVATVGLPVASFATETSPATQK